MSQRTQAEQAGCTESEIEALILHDLGWGYRRIARQQDVSLTTVRDRIRRAEQKIEQATREVAQ